MANGELSSLIPLHIASYKMGQSYSTQLVEQGPPWDAYVSQGWRSDRARELDRLGGDLLRTPRSGHYAQRIMLHPGVFGSAADVYPLTL